MPSNKRAGDEVEGGAKKKGGGAGRTGQACDRCKVRKIRCDARVGGCSPCIQNNTECKTTDRITGRANTRGHAETLENENTSLKMYMVELQQQLRENGLEPKAPPSVPQRYLPAQPYWEQNGQQGSWGALNPGNGLMSSSKEPEAQGSVLPDFRPGCIGDNYLGVSSGNNWLSPIEGTSLALFGMKLDVADLLPSDSDPTAAPMSYQTFLLHAMGKSQVSPPQLPNYDECKLYAEWYFKTVQVFVPVLHKPEFMKLLIGIFQGQHEANSAETVMVHTVIAIMKFQLYCRNGGDQMRSESMSHYHYALTFVPDLITGHTLQDIQALIVICSQLRSQPRPGAAWMFTNSVFGLAVEVGLNRSASNWQGAAAERDSHTIEMRKRIFYSILVLHVNISGKLGRPMPIRLEDFDIEIPEAEPDNMPEEKNLSKWRKCSFRAAIHGFKLLKILMQVYSTLYSIRSSAEPYDISVQNIDKQLDNFREQVPAELSGGPETVEEDRCPALYLQLSEHQIRQVLHHPSLCRSTSPQLMADNLDACLDASRNMLIAASQLKDLKSLDATWMQSTDFLAAIFTTLFIYTQRQDEISSADLQGLRQDMDTWLDVMGNIGNLLGAGLKLRDAVRGFVDYSLGNISRHLAAKTASAADDLTSPSPPGTATEQAPAQRDFEPPESYSNTYTNGTTDNLIPRESLQRLVVTENRPTQPPLYPSGGHFFSDPRHGAITGYNSGSMTGFETSDYDGEDLKPNVVPQLNGQNSALASQTPQQNNHQPQVTPQQLSPTFVPGFHSPPNQNGFHSAAQPVDMHFSGPAAWRNFADTVVTNMGGQDFMNSASALMALGNDKHHGMEMPGADVSGIGGLQIPHDIQQTWPLLHYTSHPHPGDR